MSMRTLHILELIEIEVENGKGRRAALGIREGVAYPVFEGRTVRKTRYLVGRSERANQVGSKLPLIDLGQ